MRKMKKVLSLEIVKIFQIDKFRYMITENFLNFGVFKMKKYFLAFVYAIFFVSNSFSQTAKPTPKAAAEDYIVKISPREMKADCFSSK